SQSGSVSRSDSGGSRTQNSSMQTTPTLSPLRRQGSSDTGSNNSDSFTRLGHLSVLPMGASRTTTTTTFERRQESIVKSGNGNRSSTLSTLAEEMVQISESNVGNGELHNGLSEPILSNNHLPDLLLPANHS